mmetsp:Transcript_119456/g.333259  ORF Transcript_119456/g.333259 Transcript_119456/m.333259 type:complete len:203 (-) Transcript_119456:787-1395(-)
MTPTGRAKTTAPYRIVTAPTRYPASVMGKKSPYPTVVMVTKTHQKEIGTDEKGLGDRSYDPSGNRRRWMAPSSQRPAQGHFGSFCAKKTPRSVYQMRVPSTTSATRISTTTSCRAGQAFLMTSLKRVRTIFRSFPRSTFASEPSLNMRNIRTTRNVCKTLECCPSAGFSSFSISPSRPPMVSSTQKGTMDTKSTMPIGEHKK